MKKTRKEYPKEYFKPGTIVRKFSGKKFKNGSKDAVVKSLMTNPYFPILNDAALLEDGTIVSLHELYPVPHIIIRDRDNIKYADIICSGLTVLTGPCDAGVSQVLSECGEIMTCTLDIYPVHITPKSLMNSFPSELNVKVFRESLINTLRMEIKMKECKMTPKRESEKWTLLTDKHINLGYSLFITLLAYIQNQLINSNTLIIIDDACCFMDPYLSVKFARILVKLIKTYRCSVILSTHVPVLVTALQSFSISENISKDDIHFYTAKEKDGENGIYDYVDAGSEINLCFEVFNKAYTLIDMYSSLDIFGNEIKAK